MRFWPVLGGLVGWLGCSSPFPYPTDLSSPEFLPADAMELYDAVPETRSDTAADRRETGPSGDAVVNPTEVWDPGCVPQCWDRVCGPDGCGGVCGVCPPGTQCSFAQTMCISESVQKPLGASCGVTDRCTPEVVVSGQSYPNPDWPACLHDQCREGPCVSGFCSRPCRMMQDVVVNGTALMVPDGIEDADSPVTDCSGAQSDRFAGEFACVQVRADVPTGLCYPKSSFAPCERPQDCVAGESCGFLLVLGSVETRCVVQPAGAIGLGGDCSYEAGATAIACSAWACGSNGCTWACVSDADCATPGASCDARGGVCRETGGRCETDGDCSAWVCRPDVSFEELGTVARACAPRECARDADCEDPGYYCRHRVIEPAPGQVAAAGACEPKTASARRPAEVCHDDPGDGLPDLVCEDRAYCLDGRCGAMCATQEDCAEGMACVLHEFEWEGSAARKPDVPVPVCEWVGMDSAPCEVQADCKNGVCTPWVLAAEAAPVALCTDPPAGAVGFGSLCGAGAFGQSCDTRFCLGEDPENLVPGVCSRLCRDRDDCPEVAPIGPDWYRFVCEAMRFHQAGTVFVGDDAYASWCIPVPASSTLARCDTTGTCEQPGETCRAFVRSGVPGGTDRVEYLCVAASGGAPGAYCDPQKDGTACRSGVCAPTAIPGVGFCTVPCATADQCAAFAGGAARCVDRVVIPRDPPEEPITVRECRVVEACVTCQDDRDCPDPGLRCAEMASLPYLDDFRCAPVCEQDADCATWGAGVTCSEVEAALATEKTGKVRVCAPLPCP